MERKGGCAATRTVSTEVRELSSHGAVDGIKTDQEHVGAWREAALFAHMQDGIPSDEKRAPVVSRATCMK